MKRFLHKLAWFALFSVVLSTGVLLLIVMLNRMAVDSCDLDDRVTAVIVGDSHMMWSIDAGEIEALDNIAFNAEGYVYTYYKLRQLLRTDPQVRHVYLGFGYHNLAGYYDDYIDGSQSTNFVYRYIGVMPLGDLFKLMLKNPGDFPTLFKNILQKGARAGVKQECTLYGSFPKNRKTETFDPSHLQTRIAEQYYDADGHVIGVSESNREYLGKIVELLRDKGVEITLLNTPLHKDYLRAIPDEYKELYRDFIERNQLPVFDFDGLALSDAEFLPDGDHVNFYGAMLATKAFREYLDAGHD